MSDLQRYTCPDWCPEVIDLLAADPPLYIAEIAARVGVDRGQLYRLRRRCALFDEQWSAARPDNRATARTRQAPPWAEQVLQGLEDNPHLSIAEIARRVGVRPVYLYIRAQRYPDFRAALEAHRARRRART